jgi:hypothetical protein
MYDTITTSSSQQTNSQLRSNFCSWYSSYRTQHSGASASVGIPIGDIPVSFGGSYTFGSADALNQAMCQSSSSINANDGRFQNVQQFIDPNAAQAFQSCITAEQHGLSGTAFIADDSSVFNLQLIYTPPPGTQGGTTIQSVAIIPPDAFTCPNPTTGTDIRSLVGQVHQFNNVSASLSCQRNFLSTPIVVGAQSVAAKSGIISINTDAGSFTQQFRAIPASNPLSNTAQVMAAFPRGTILAWAGQLSNIPQGWRLCDGTNGTPNLNHRFPLGTLAPGEVLMQVGLPNHSHAYSGTTSVPHGIDNPDVVQHHPAGLNVKGTDHTHTFGGQTDMQPNLPESTYVMFIMRAM